MANLASASGQGASWWIYPAGVVVNCMTPLERALDLSYAAFAILHQHGRFSGPQHQRVCEAILGDLRIARRQGVRGVVLEIFSRDQQVMGSCCQTSGLLSSWASMTAP